MSPRDRFKSFSPESIYLDLHHQNELVELLRKHSWIPAADEIRSIEKPGEGNMNFVARIKTSSTSVIIKQSRPWVEKYPQISAPVKRIFVEAAFYKALKHDRFYDSFCPSVIGFDEKNFLLALEDLGEGADYTDIYKRDTPLPDTVLLNLTGFISHLHNTSPGNLKSYPANLELKKLNHTHIFYYPYLEDNGFDLDTIQPGLQNVAMRYKTNESLKGYLKHLGDVYLQKGNTLIHGDYYPGSWLKTTTGVRIIDPEFSHLGNHEFDLGVMMAHLKMAKRDRQLPLVWNHYLMPPGTNLALVSSFCGVEIMRRIIGLAQLPLYLSLDEKDELLRHAEQLIMTPEEQKLF